MVKRLEDIHLIKIVKSYKHGDSYNFVFPCAKTNLDILLRDPSFEPFADFCGTVPQHPIWKEMRGVSRALHKVLDCEISSTQLGKSLYGYHFDLKPANILVDWSGVLVITDFGQAKFKEVDGTSSNVMGMGGNEAYAPPEIDQDFIKTNRTYDIWSFGCILLEVLAFVVKGRGGLSDLDKVRCRDDVEAHTRDDRYFRRTPASVSQLSRGICGAVDYELKPQILQWVQLLPESVPDGPSRRFIEKVLNVALKMLNVDCHARLTSKEVCMHLSEIISEYQDHDSQPGSNAHVMPQPPSEGLRIGTELMARIQKISYNVEGYWSTAPLHFVQENALLYVHVFEDRAWVPQRLGPWSQLRLLPLYALGDCANDSSPSVTISFTPTNSSTTFQRRHGKFSTSNVDILQEILLAQKVHKSLKLSSASVELKRVRSLSTLMYRGFGRSRPSDAMDSIEVHASSVQLWTACLRQDIIGPNAAARRQLPRALPLGPVPVRIVIFYQKSILILRLAKNQRIEPRSDSAPSSTSITIVPTDRATDPSFCVSILRPKSNETLPGFSLSKDQFEAHEMENRVECNSLKLTFFHKEEADSFQRTYKKLKKRWSEQIKEVQNLRNHIVEEIGYSQST